MEVLIQFILDKEQILSTLDANHTIHLSELEVGEGGVNRRYKVGRRSGSTPTEVGTGVSRLKV